MGGFFFNCLSEIGEPRDPPWLVTRASLAHAIGHHLLNCKLWLTYDGRYPFYSLTTVKMNDWNWATGRWLSQFSMMVRAVSGEAPAPVIVPTVVVTTGGPSPSSNSMWEVLVWWVDGTSLGSTRGYG
jgi:hypothetical protein